MALDGASGAGGADRSNGGGSDHGGSGGVDRGTEDRVSAAMEQARSSRSDDGSRSGPAPGAGKGSMDGGDDAAVTEARASQERLEAQGQVARRGYEDRQARQAEAVREAAGASQIAGAIAAGMERTAAERAAGLQPEGVQVAQATGTMTDALPDASSELGGQIVEGALDAARLVGRGVRAASPVGAFVTGLGIGPVANGEMPPETEAQMRARMSVVDPDLLGPNHTGTRPPADPGLGQPTVTLPVDSGLTGSQTMGGVAPAPALPGIVSTPVADPDLLGDGVVTMADPNNEQAMQAEQDAYDRLREAFPDAEIRRGVVYYRPDGTEATEVDIFVDDVPVEVTIGRGKDKQRQAGETIDAVGSPSVLMGPRVGGTVERNLREQYGVVTVRTLDDLVNVVRGRMEP